MTLPLPGVRRTFAKVVYSLFGLVPVPYRFRAARVAAFCAGGPADRLVSLWRQLRSPTRQEYYLSSLLVGMDSVGLRFDPELENSGLDEFKAASQMGRGALLLGVHGHAGLDYLLPRLLREAGLPFVVLSHAAEYPIAGAGETAETLGPSGSFLLTVRSKIRSGSIVCGLIDSPTPSADRTQVVIDGVSVWLSTALLRVALRWEAPVAFFRARLTGRSVSIELEPCSITATTENAIEAFTAFQSAATPTRSARSPQSPFPRPRSS